MKRKIQCLLLILLLCLLACGCGEQEDDETAGGYAVYYTNTESTKMTSVSYKPESTTSEDLVNELLMQLATPPLESDRKVAKPESVVIEKAELDGHTLFLTFSEKYRDMDRIAEVLCRTAYVKTLTQIPGVEQVEFYVGKEPLKNEQGAEIGPMNGDSFIDDTDKEIGAYKVGDITLYYANKEGSKLVPVTVEAVLGRSVATEKIVVEKLIMGPDASTRGVIATIPQGTKLLGISTDEGVCYVNLSEEFLKPLPDVKESVSLYSIVNSLCQLPNIDKVQFAINGDSERTFIEDISFSTLFEKNKELVEVKE